MSREKHAHDYSDWDSWDYIGGGKDMRARHCPVSGCPRPTLTQERTHVHVDQGDGRCLCGEQKKRKA